ncbi:MAG: KH domain-containing protein [Verrucomicrobiota bacterium]|nr:KH domain-containing protein [Verrucomicrobiota bacterium]|tara:strand:- start:84 stop:533 length:450 start_codon:yes stop_codon:yes gene_type:complete
MADDSKTILENLLERLGFEATVNTEERDSGIVLNIECDDAGRLIGRQGRTLADLQYLTNRLSIAADDDAPKVTVDVGNYRGQSKNELAKQANAAAEKARRWGDIVEMEPMNAYDRRIVHQTLKDREDVVSESIEVEGTSNKVIIIRPKG